MVAVDQAIRRRGQAALLHGAGEGRAIGLVDGTV